MPDRITYATDFRGRRDLDEIVFGDVEVHAERMNSRAWWIGIYKDGVEINLYCRDLGIQEAFVGGRYLPEDEEWVAPG